MPYVEANHKNEPLLPRSASFGSQSQLQSQLQKLTAKASNVVSSVCQGEEAGVKLACLNGGLAGLAPRGLCPWRCACWVRSRTRSSLPT